MRPQSDAMYKSDLEPRSYNHNGDFPDDESWQVIRQGLEESITVGQQPDGSVQKTVQIIRVPVSGVDRTGNESAKKRCA